MTSIDDKVPTIRVSGSDYRSSDAERLVIRTKVESVGRTLDGVEKKVVDSTSKLVAALLKEGLGKGDIRDCGLESDRYKYPYGHRDGSKPDPGKKYICHQAILVITSDVRQAAQLRRVITLNDVFIEQSFYGLKRNTRAQFRKELFVSTYEDAVEAGKLLAEAAGGKLGNALKIIEKYSPGTTPYGGSGTKNIMTEDAPEPEDMSPIRLVTSMAVEVTFALLYGQPRKQMERLVADRPRLQRKAA